MASSSNSSIQKSFKYDVFLSFRGEDTRNSFVGHLYQALKQKGIETYKDDEKIEQGETINDQLMRSIQDSRFFIIVFSKTYASSSWCLDELVKIMECRKTRQTAVFPIFYDVEPTEVRKQKGVVGKAFSIHENKEAAGKWREAMKEASNLAGWELKKIVSGDESKLIPIIVDVIFKRLCFINVSVDGKLVGMETRINEILSSLEMDNQDVRIIGIKGMGGGGKTTLAEAVCDQISLHFEGISFVENVRVVSKESPSGLKMLQKQILADVLNKQDIIVSSVRDGKRMMGNMMRGTKVLIVLDDVDHKSQLEALAGDLNWFKSGSRIIITTRDEQVLLSHGVSLICNVNLLKDDEAVCLFNRYAFGKKIPTQGYNEMLGQVVRYADGLPLTVKVLGSFLCGKKDIEWKNALERLKKIPEHETQEILKISYDALEKDYKEIFLDVACILKGEQKDKAIRVLESCGFNAIIGLRVLEEKSLLSVSKYGSLAMHDRIEEMGKYIDCHLHPDEHNRHSRLWIDKEIEDILANNQINEAIRCIKLSPQRLDLRTFMTGLRNMKKLRVLYMCSGSYWDDSRVSQLFPNSLQYLCWRAYPFSSLHETFQADNLAGLDMSFSPILQLLLVRKGKALTKLRFLDLSYTGLGRLNLGLTPNLESLDLKDCWNLVEINAPVGCLKNLLYMDLSGCGIMEVPKDLHHLLHLEELYLSKTKIKYLPDSICMLKQLKFINLEDCHNLEKLPDDFGQLDSLEELILSNSKIKHLPDSVCMLKKLKSLKLQGCKHFERLPESFGQMECQEKIGCLECLQELDITGTAISHLPQCIFGLKGVRIIGSKMMLESFGFTSEIQSSDNETFVEITGGPMASTSSTSSIRMLVGMETRISDVLSSLEISTQDVRMIGIKGMGGGGKTTLAKVVYDQISLNFEGISFVENVHEVSKPSLCGLKKLQKRILKDVLNKKDITFSSVHDGKNMLKDMMSRRKTLVVLDDVDCIEQLEALAGSPDWFKSGSRIIITTRHEQVLLAHGVNFVHDVNLLSHEEAVCLFSRHAFQKEIPIRGYEELSWQVVQYADGLPLMIKVLGSFLCDQKEIYWKDAIERLKIIPLTSTMEKLEISFHGLENDYKEILLDVACILKGWWKEDAIRALKSCGYHAEVGLRVLEKKSLITIDESGYLGMHDHLEEMGKNIVRRLHPNEPNKHSRLWIDKEIEYILTNDPGTQATKCLYLDSPGFSDEIAIKGLAKMQDLRFIHIEDYFKSNIVQLCEYLPSSLRFIRWDGFPFSNLPNTFQGENLVGLEMEESKIVQLWEDEEEKVLPKLRFLTFHSSNLQTFDLRVAPNLERLTIYKCYDFIELHMHAHYLKLKCLNLSHSKFTTLHLTSTPNLEKLILEGCNDLVELWMPDEIPKLQCFKLSHSKLRTLDLGITPNLKKLILEGCNDLVRLRMPDEIPKLQCFVLTHSMMRTLYLRSTPNLEKLILEGCNDLVKLRMPDKFPKLQCFKLSHSKMMNLYLRSTPNLEKLILEGCNDLVRLWMPDEIPKLQCFKLSHSKLRTLDLGITPNLKKLILEGCNDLVKLRMPDEFPKLQCLVLSHSKLKTLYLRSTPNLEKLIVEGCNDLVQLRMPDEIPKLEWVDLSLSKLTNLHLGNTPNLKRLNLENCNGLVDINAPVGCLKFDRLVFLEELNFSSTDIRILPDSICMLNQLKLLEIISCWLLEKLPEDLGRLQCLEKLILTDCKVLQDLPNSICKMKSLISLHLDECRQIMKLPEEMGHLGCLKELDITRSGISCLPMGIFQLKGLRIVGEDQQLKSFGFTSEIQTSENKATVIITGTQSSSLVTSSVF